MEQNKIMENALVMAEENLVVSPVEESIATINTQALFEQAIEKNTPIETMERLLAMRRELKAEAARDSYFKSLSAFQMECPIIEKKKPVCDKSGTVRYKYAPLDDILSQVKPVLLKHGFSYTIKTKQDNESVTAVCYTHHVDGHSESTEFRVPIDAKAYMNVAQKVASALTFSKRYSFCDAFGIITGDGDDDSNYTGSPVSEKPKINNQKISVGNAPEQNRALYTGIMSLIREKCEKQDLFTQKEKVENKSKADAVIGNYESIKNLYSAINKVAQKKRRAIRMEAGSDE